MHSTTTDSIMNTFSPSAATTATTVPRGPPGIVTYRYQHEKASEMAYVPLADSHEEAQDIAARALAGLAGVDPRWLVFTITIRYRKTNERQEIAIAPGAWSYVTSRLVPYRVIDVHVDSPTPPPPPPPPLSSPLAPPSPAKSLDPPYPDSPPPRYSGGPHKNIPLPPEEEGFGYGWHDHQRGNRSARPDNHYLDPREMADRRSSGWSASSVKVHRRPYRGPSLFGRFKQNGFGIFPIFPITWNDTPPPPPPEEHTRRRGKGRTRGRGEKKRERERDHFRDDDHEHASGSHSYVPSLI